MARRVPLFKARDYHTFNRIKSFFVGPFGVLVRGGVFDYVAPVPVFCSSPTCKKYVSSNTAWKCGFCDHENTLASRGYFSFLNRCARCGEPARAYVCPHCDWVNFLDARNDGQHAALVARVPSPPTPTPPNATPPTVATPPPEDPVAQKRKEHLEKKRSREEDIEITTLDVKLADLKASLTPKVKPSAREKLETSFSEFEAHILGAHMVASDSLKRYEEQFRDDPEQLERGKDAVRTWLDRQI